MDQNLGGAGDDRGYSVQQTSDGGYIVAGVTNSYGDSGQVYLLKTDASGDTLWTRSYGGARYEYARSVRQTLDGGYIAVGGTSSFGNGLQVYLLKTNALGDTLWTRVYGGANDEGGDAVQQTSDGGYIIAGYTCSFGAGNEEVYLIRTNPSGETVWTRTYGEGDFASGSSVQQTSDGGYVIAGTTGFWETDNQVYLIKTNARGDTFWTRTYGGVGDERGYSAQQTSDGGFIVAGWTSSFGNSYQAYLIKTDSNGRAGVAEMPKVEVRTTNSPANVVRGVLEMPSTAHGLPLTALVDISGRKAMDLHPGANDISRLAPGVYFVRQETPHGGPIRRVVLVR